VLPGVLEHTLSEAPLLVKSVSGELYKCNRCGFCQTRCPVYRMTGLESSVARGHFARLQAVLEQNLPFDDAIRDSLFACLMCRACTAECPPAIATDRIISAARASYIAQRQSRLQRLVFRRLLGNAAALRVGALKRTRLTLFAKLLRLLPWVDRGLAEAQAMMPTPKSFLRDRLVRRDPPPVAKGQVVYFVGCGIDYTLPEVGEATLDVLEAAGYDVVVVRNVCCGLPPYSYGDLEAARALAAKNLEVLAAYDAQVIVTDCGSCSSFLRDYGRLFEVEDPTRSRAESLAARVREFSEFLGETGLPRDLRPVKAVVTYHDPCHLSRYQQVVTQPRELLRSIPAMEYRELQEADWCCGAAGSYALTHYDLSMQILARKMANIRSTAAEIVATACPACITQLRYGARKCGVGVEVVHLSQLLRRALPPAHDCLREGSVSGEAGRDCVR